MSWNNFYRSFLLCKHSLSRQWVFFFFTLKSLAERRQQFVRWLMLDVKIYLWTKVKPLRDQNFIKVKEKTNIVIYHFTYWAIFADSNAPWRQPHIPACLRGCSEELWPHESPSQDSSTLVVCREQSRALLQFEWAALSTDYTNICTIINIYQQIFH